jgi:glycosyltransferase involved in cell wall biosynthesis
MLRKKVSAFVVSFNGATVIGTCLRALRFADEVIVVDKSSTDETPVIAARHANRVITVPWSPTADDTRAFALAQCAHDWIVFVDDDECLSPEAVQFIQAELTAPRADVYSLALRHYILGTHTSAPMTGRNIMSGFSPRRGRLQRHDTCLCRASAGSGAACR